jgi:ATP-dependent RNA helicase DeaD
MQETVAQAAESTSTFKDFGLADAILNGVTEAGFESPTPIQQHSIPAILSGRDVIAQAKTGSGKTAAFCLPAMSRLKFDKSVEILVLCPTRELATQVADDAFELGRQAGVKTVSVVGGEHIYRQVELINRGAHLVAATPGRLMDHMREGRLKNFHPHIVVLDEADEMLDMGFIDDIRSILSSLPKERQTLLFSATMPNEMRALAKEFMVDPVHIKLSQDNVATDSVEQRLYAVKSEEKLDALIRIIDVENPEKFLVFCRTKADVDQLSESLVARGISVHALHGDIGQKQRSSTVQSLSEGRIRCVIATDVAARGLDIPGLTHVININVPEDRQRYIHRIGRTGRGSTKGIAITIGSPQELRRSGCFNAGTRKEFELREIPSRKEAIQATGKSILKQIEDTTVCEDWADLASELLAKESSQELIVKMLSLIASKKRVRGHDRIGLAVEQSEKLFMKDRSEKPRYGFGYRGKRPEGDRPRPFRKFADRGAPRSDTRSDSRPSYRSNDSRPNDRGERRFESGRPPFRGVPTGARSSSANGESNSRFGSDSQRGERPRFSDSRRPDRAAFQDNRKRPDQRNPQPGR